MKASIVITCYNLGAYLEEALESACRTTYPDTEIIVVDDGSTDPDTHFVLNTLQDRYRDTEQIHFLSQENQGLSAARNFGIRHACGECILPLDADNRLQASYIEKAVHVLKGNRNVGVVYGWAELFGSQTGIREYPDIDLQEMLLGNQVDACAVFRKSVWEDIGGYDTERFREGYEDWDFWLGALERGWRFHRLPEVMFDYRVRPGSMVSACNEPAIRQKLVTQLIEKHNELYASCWPELLVRRELTTLAYEKAVAGYHQRYVESLAEFHAFAKQWDERVTNAEQIIQDQRTKLHHLRYELLVAEWRDRLIARVRRALGRA